MEIQLEEFNNCPGKEEVEKYLDTLIFKSHLEVKDANHKYWQNDSATLVLMIKDRNALTFHDGYRLGGLGAALGADEQDSLIEGGKQFIRLWWD